VARYIVHSVIQAIAVALGIATLTFLIVRLSGDPTQHLLPPNATKEDIRGILGQMLFRGEEGLKKTDALSGGEAARLLFCKIMLQKPNVLVFDEPTNHLDLEAINALNIALQRYDGTVLLVTHDHDLIDEVATRIWHFEAGEIIDFNGK